MALGAAAMRVTHTSVASTVMARSTCVRDLRNRASTLPELAPAWAHQDRPGKLLSRSDLVYLLKPGARFAVGARRRGHENPSPHMTSSWHGRERCPREAVVVTIVDVVAVLVGSMVAIWLVSSAVRTVVMPRPERVWLTRVSFEFARRGSMAVARRIRSPARRHRVLGAFAPSVMIALPLIWSAGLIASFTVIYWGLDVGSLSDSIGLSGSSLTTLGFVSAPSFTTRVVAIVQAHVGIAVVALMIGFLPTIYGAFSRREVAVGRLTTRAGQPPDPVVFITRLVSVDRLRHVDERWSSWEDWFNELGETHTTFPALVYFRSARPGKSWLAAAEVALDTAAILRATDLTPDVGQADTMINSGYSALQGIADFYGIRTPEDRAEDADLTVTRADFDELLAELAAASVVIDVAPDDAWQSYRAWRVHYDDAVQGLRARIGDLPSHWERRRSLRNDHEMPPR